MAAPKNANKHQKKDTQKEAPTLGRKIRFVGASTSMTCPTCGHSRRSGMVSEFQSKLYCDEVCIAQRS